MRSFGSEARFVEFPKMITTEWELGSVQEVAWSAHCLLMAAVNYIRAFKVLFYPAVAVAALCLIVYYCHEKHIFHPHLVSLPKWDSCPTKMG